MVIGARDRHIKQAIQQTSEKTVVEIEHIEDLPHGRIGSGKSHRERSVQTEFGVDGKRTAAKLEVNGAIFCQRQVLRIDGPRDVERSGPPVQRIADVDGAASVHVATRGAGRGSNVEIAYRS